MTSSRAGGEKTDTMAEERGRRKPAIDERRPLPPEPDRAPDPWNDGPWNEIASLLLFAAGMVLLLSLISYSSADPSINALRTETRIRNLMGPFGANLSDLLYQLFGLTSLFLPLALFAAGWIQWRESQSQLTKGHLLGLLLMFVAMTGILTFMGGRETPKSFYLGGVLGRWLVYGPVVGLEGVLGPLGTIFVLMTIFVVGLVIGTPITVVGSVLHFTPLEQRLAQFTPGAGRFWSRRDRLASAAALQPEASGRRATEPEVRREGRDGQRGRPLPASTKGSLPEIKGSLPEIKGSLQETEYPSFPIEVDGGPAASDAAPSGSRPARREAAASPKRPARRPVAEPIPDGPGDLHGEDEDETPPTVTRTVEEMMAETVVRRPDASASPSVGRMAPAASRPAKPPARSRSSYQLPSTEMLSPPPPRSEMEETELVERARQLAEKCFEFNVSGRVMHISPGPVVTTFEFKPDPGVKYSRVTSLVDDLCLALKAESIRIDRIPGKSTVGIEVPNRLREMIHLREVIESSRFQESGSKLTFALGKTIDGSNYAADLARMPHLLIAGATGAGKSVMLNTILVSLLYKATPDQVKMILVDPKRLELGLYADIPHLLTPIVTDPKRASNALRWAVSEMENRYKHLAAFGVRNIEQYNTEVVAGKAKRRTPEAELNETTPEPLPFIVVIIDELADLMMVSARDVEESITRLAQMARAVGIHLVLATQRPSVDVITGLIKANFPSRISFRVSSKVDSRTIIDTNGAEQLLGQGDMLFLPPGTARLVRVHGAYVDEKEVTRICDFVRSQANPIYDDKVVLSEKEAEGGEAGDLVRDEKYDDALRVVLQSGKASTSLLQRTLRIGYGRAASIIDMMYREGIVGPEDGSKPRQVLIKGDFLERLDQLRDDPPF